MWDALPLGGVEVCLGLQRIGGWTPIQASGRQARGILCRRRAQVHPKGSHCHARNQHTRGADVVEVLLGLRHTVDEGNGWRRPGTEASSDYRSMRRAQWPKGKHCNSVDASSAM